MTIVSYIYRQVEDQWGGVFCSSLPVGLALTMRKLRKAQSPMGKPSLALECWQVHPIEPKKGEIIGNPSIKNKTTNKLNIKTKD